MLIGVHCVQYSTVNVFLPLCFISGDDFTTWLTGSVPLERGVEEHQALSGPFPGASFTPSSPGPSPKPQYPACPLVLWLWLSGVCLPPFSGLGL